jgi:hypothetical protein
MSTTMTRKAKKARKKTEKAARRLAGDARKKAERRAEDIADRLKDSDALAKAEELAMKAQKRIADAHLDEKVADLADRAQVTGGKLAAKAQKTIADAHIEERVADLTERVRDSESAQQAMETARRITDSTLAALGGWIATGKAADKLGVEPKRRRFPAWLAALLGAGVGYLVGTLTAPKRGDELRDDFAQSAERLMDQTRFAATEAVEKVAERPLAELIRGALDDDHRTAALPDLTINVAEGTVFIRGTVPGSFDEDAVRSVIAAVPGVKDVDLQLTVATS